MATKLWPTLMLVPALAYALTAEERALQLNEEMDWMLKAAPKAQVYGSPEFAGQTRRGARNGLAPTQMQGVENVEDRFFSDEVRFQAAASDRINETQAIEDDFETDYRVDGRVPKSSKR